MAAKLDQKLETDDVDVGVTLAAEKIEEKVEQAEAD